MTDLKELQKRLGYTFQDVTLLVRAITHRSKHKVENNERLEFLGDSVLSLVISDALFVKYPDAREGELSRLRAALVKGETISKLALTLELDRAMHLGIGELKSGGHQRASILAGTFESVIGAIYRDSDLETIRKIILKWYGNRIYDVESVTDVKDAKSRLQEWLQAQYLPLPHYEVVASGRAHAQTFDVTCTVEGLEIKTHGRSSSRRKAEQLAAKQFLEKINE